MIRSIALRPGLARGVASGMGAGALWGLVFLVPQLLPDFSPAQQAVARYLAYGLLALALLAPRWGKATAGLGAVQWRALLWLSVLGNLLYFVLLASAVHAAGSAATALIVGLVPVVVTVAGARGGHGHGPRLAALAGPCLLSRSWAWPWWPPMRCWPGVGWRPILPGAYSACCALAGRCCAGPRTRSAMPTG